MTEKRDNKFLVKTLIFLSGIIIILLVVWKGLKYFDDKSKDNSSINEKISYDSFIYKIRYDFGNESYIYLLENDVLMTIEKKPIFEPVEGCNCVKHTGEFEEVKEIKNFSSKTKKEVINVLEKLAKQSGTNDFDSAELALTKYEQRILLAIMLNSEERITVDQNLKFETVVENWKSKNNKYKIENSKMVLDNKTGNTVVNNIANYLNEIVNADFIEINELSKNIVENESIYEDLGVSLRIEKVYEGTHSISFIYVTEGQLGVNSIYDIKGYTFNYNGNVKVFDMNGLKDGYYQDALKEFMNSELYINNKGQLVTNWESILYENMFLTGNWYLADDKLELLIPGYLLGFDTATIKVISVSVENNEEF